MPKRRANLPNEVREAVGRLKSESGSGIVAVKIKGNYYAYASKDWTDSITGRRHTERLYIGRINTDGTVSRKVRNRLPGRPINLEQYISMKYKTSSMITDKATAPNDLDRAILMQMSMDARASVPDIAKRLNAEKSLISYRIKKLSKLYGIWPTLDIRPTKFGFSRFLILVKFLNDRPGAERIKKILEPESRIYLVLLAKGEYDMIIYAFAEDIPALETMLYRIRSDSVFADYKAVWTVSYLYEAFGWFVPNRDAFFELIKDRVWRRTRESPKKLPNQLLRSEYVVMREMVKDCRTDFSAIDKAYGLRKGSAQYTYHKLFEAKLVDSATICIQNPHAKYSVFIYLEQDDIVAFNKTRGAYFQILTDEPRRPTNRFAYDADVSSPYGIAVIAPIYDDPQLEELLDEIKSRINGIAVKYTVITNQLVGKIGFRKYDLTQTPSYTRMQQLEKEEKS